jgi:tRNA 2-thiocytidine biosynthesis protein TtcA
MLAAWERESPGRVESIFTAICNVSVSQLADPVAFDFQALRGGGDPGPSRQVANPSWGR